MRFPVIPVLITAVTVAGGISPVFAQGPGGGPPPFPGGPGGGRGGFGGGGRMGGGFGRELTAVTTPLEALDAYLKLSAEQKSRIEQTVQQVRSQMPRPPAPPQPGENGGAGAPPQRPSREEMEARMQKMQAAEQKANREIEALLTSEQRAKLPTVLKALTALRADRIALPVAGKLALTDSQIAKLAALGEKATHEQVAAVLSAQQNEVADANRMQRGGPGGPGGRGGGRGPDGPGGFPGGPGGPPEGGPGFPPPPPQGEWR